MISYMIPFYLSAASRMAGDSRLSLIGKVLYPVPYAVLMLPIGNYFDQNSLIWSICYCSVTYAWVFCFKATGHADGFAGYVRDNMLSKYVVFLSSFFAIKRDSKTYDALFWMVKGALIPAITLNPFLIIASAIGYPLAYYLGFHHLHKRLGMVHTAWGELLAGFFAGIGFIGGWK